MHIVLSGFFMDICCLCFIWIYEKGNFWGNEFSLYVFDEFI